MSRTPAEPNIQAVLRMEKQINNFIQKQSEMVKVLQKRCKHLNIIECPPLCSISSLGSSFPPRRKCTDCLWEEDGWVFYKLNSKKGRTVSQVTRDELYNHRIHGKEYWNGL